MTVFRDQEAFSRHGEFPESLESSCSYGVLLKDELCRTQPLRTKEDLRLGRPPTDMRYFSSRQIVIRNESSVQREKESILEKHIIRFSQRLCNTGRIWTVLCWAEGWGSQLGRARQLGS